MVDERPAPGPIVHGPAGRMDDSALLVLRRVQLPQLLNADAVGLGVAAGPEVKSLFQALCERSSAALREERVFGQKLHARLPGGLLLAISRDAHVAGCNPPHPALLVVKHLGGCKSRINLGA